MCLYSDGSNVHEILPRRERGTESTTHYIKLECGVWPSDDTLIVQCAYPRQFARGMVSAIPGESDVRKVRVWDN